MSLSTEQVRAAESILTSARIINEHIACINHLIHAHSIPMLPLAHFNVATFKQRMDTLLAQHEREQNHQRGHVILPFVAGLAVSSAAFFASDELSPALLIVLACWACGCLGFVMGLFWAGRARITQEPPKWGD